MNDKNKHLWDNSLGKVDDEIVEEMADTLYKKSLSDIDSDELVIIESDNKKKRIFPIFTIAASIVAIIGVATIAGVIISNSGIFTTASGTENDSSIVSEIEGDESSQTESFITSDTESDFLTYGDFQCTIGTSDTITITAYTGNDSEIVIPKEINRKKVTNIGVEAFANCGFITSVIIPDSVTSIGNDAFYSCELLTSITIPDSVTSIGNGAFSGCASLTSVTIPDSVISIDDYAFFYCELLTAINVDTDNQKYCSVDGVLFSKDMTDLIYYPTGKTDTSYTIPDGVTSISDYAFSYCTSLTSVTIPDSVTSIAEHAFAGCSSLDSVTIPDSITSIGENAFTNTATLFCHSDSYAEKYAKENEIKYEIIESTDKTDDYIYNKFGHIKYTCDLSAFPVDDTRNWFGEIILIEDGRLLVSPGLDKGKTDFGEVVWLIYDHAYAYSVGQVVTYTYRDVKAPDKEGYPLNIIALLVYME